MTVTGLHDACHLHNHSHLFLIPFHYREAKRNVSESLVTQILRLAMD
jgi:hypothetical protein